MCSGHATRSPRRLSARAEPSLALVSRLRFAHPSSAVCETIPKILRSSGYSTKCKVLPRASRPHAVGQGDIFFLRPNRADLAALTLTELFSRCATSCVAKPGGVRCGCVGAKGTWGQPARPFHSTSSSVSAVTR